VDAGIALTSLREFPGMRVVGLGDKRPLDFFRLSPHFAQDDKCNRSGGICFSLTTILLGVSPTSLQFHLRAALRSRIDPRSSMVNPPPLISHEIHARLEAARIARLATIDADGRPHMVPICFVWDGSCLHSAIDRKPKSVAPTRLTRLKNIEETPHVALLIDEYDEDWTRLWYVLIRGEAELVTDAAERKRAIERLRVKYPQYDTKMLADDAQVLRITPVRIAVWGQI
jgi:PPOX class probable F420-dependent enzyme